MASDSDHRGVTVGGTPLSPQELLALWDEHHFPSYEDITNESDYSDEELASEPELESDDGELRTIGEEFNNSSDTVYGFMSVGAFNSFLRHQVGNVFSSTTRNSTENNTRGDDYRRFLESPPVYPELNGIHYPELFNHGNSENFENSHPNVSRRSSYEEDDDDDSIYSIPDIVHTNNTDANIANMLETVPVRIKGIGKNETQAA